MNVSEALSQARAILGVQLEAEIILAFAIRKNREFLMSHPEAHVAAAPFKKFQTLVSRRFKGVPIAYLTGHKEFYGLDFCVEPGVFIPRPETELLVEEAINKLRITRPFGCPELQICDVGTGSGCIAISLAKYIQNAQITAVDISPKALKLAKKNAKLHSVANQIRFLKSDLLEFVIASRAQQSIFDLIVANLPYIGTNENNFVSKEVLDYEPAQALFGGATGLELFEKLFKQIAAMRRMPKWLIAEIGFSQKAALTRLIKKHFGNARAVWKNDLAELPRLFAISFNKSASLRSA